MEKKILLVAFPNSIHTARWIEQLTDQGLDIHLFPSLGGDAIHNRISNITVHHLLYSKRISSMPEETSAGLKRWSHLNDLLRKHILDKKFPSVRARQLSRVIHKIRPDIVHSMEIQAAGYLTLEAKKIFHGKFPTWIVTNWGSDIYLFGRLLKHKEKIRDVLANCDYYSCECERDVKLARDFGFNKTIFPVFPNTGGFDLGDLENVRNQVLTSKRRTIMLKGYQNWSGRALVGLRALERCEDALKGYTIVIHSAISDVAIAAELFTEKTGIPTRIVPHYTPHNEILSLHAQARLSIGLSISDAISTSFLEAMVMGSFPIQSSTACADEWIEHGVSGMIVPPEDPDIIEMAIRTALSNDELVNNAAAINWRVAQTRLDGTILKQKAVDMYRSLMDRANGGAE
ncbi:MAG: glycosyltransferase [Dissulfurispiraceae bacterium]